jgi:synaptic vesicle membrane protein VAT-1
MDIEAYALAERGPMSVRVTIPAAGGLDRLRLQSYEAEQPGPGQVRIQVQAAGVNYADCIVRMGLYSSAREYVGWPITPGFEVAGVVDAVGPGAGRAVGDSVIAVTRFGGYSSSLVVPEHQVFSAPSGIPLESAAAIPTVWMTAWYALHELANAHEGETILVHSAAGGVGSALVQLARRSGVRVVGLVGSARKLEYARRLGADVALDASDPRVWSQVRQASPRGYQAIFDPNGASTLAHSKRHLARPGKLVIYGFASMLPRTGQRLSWLQLAYDFLRTPRFDPFSMTQASTSVLAFNLSYLFDQRALLARGMEFVLGALERGEVRALPVQTFPVSDVAAAHAALESGQTTGKLVLTFPHPG